MSGMYIEIFLRFFFNTENVQNVYRDRFKVFFNAEMSGIYIEIF
jgi:hypothetical protein